MTEKKSSLLPYPLRWPRNTESVADNLRKSVSSLPRGLMTVLPLLENKLGRLYELDHADLETLRSLPVLVRSIPARTSIIRSGDRAEQSLFVMRGVLTKQKTIGRRTQILGLHLQSDWPNLQSLYLNVADHDLIAASACELAVIAHSDLRRVIRTRHNLRAAFWLETLNDAAIARSWLINIGQRRAIERLAYFLLELGERMRGLGQSADRYCLPLSQREIGQALGITDVHANRLVKKLSKLVSVRYGKIVIHNRKALVALAGLEND